MQDKFLTKIVLLFFVLTVKFFLFIYRSRIDNLGFVTQQTFQQFFDWFVMEPTIEAIMNGVEHGFTEGHATVPPPTTASENRDNVVAANNTKILDLQKERETLLERQTLLETGAAKQLKSLMERLKEEQQRCVDVQKEVDIISILDVLVCTVWACLKGMTL